MALLRLEPTMALLRLEPAMAPLELTMEDLGPSFESEVILGLYGGKPMRREAMLPPALGLPRLLSHLP